jgi:adenine C2-methylase RlmN of 23S rRNA A2503 and tRNA A37
VEEALCDLLSYKKTIQQNDKIMNRFVKFHRTSELIEIHYTLIDSINDSNSELEKLCHFLSIDPIPIKFISFNPINHLKKSTKENDWVQTIQKNLPENIVKTYLPPGREVGSSCGEFTKHYYHSEIETNEDYQEFLEWKKTHEIMD